MTDATETRSPGRLERLGDRLNPILVKEVRQALRGRYFRVSFWFTLCAASVFGLGWLVFQADVDGTGGEALGVGFYTFAFACLAVATHGLVPFSAFVSMGAEWDENTYDLLVLSNLRPYQIVVGKVLSAGVQALLYYSAFGPFLVFAFLLRGVDLRALWVTLLGSALLSFALSCLAVSLSSLSRARFSRVVLMALLAAFLIVGPTIQGIVAGSAVMRFPNALHQPEAISAVIGVLTFFVAAGILFLLIGAARLAHPEENRSSALRVFCLILPIGFLGWTSYVSLTYASGQGSRENLAFTTMALIFIWLSALFFATEPERLGRRVGKHVPHRQPLALLASPFLPGGARGLLWYLVASTVVIAWSFGMEALSVAQNPRYGGFSYAESQVALTVAGYGLIYLGLPSLVFARFSEDARLRVVCRVSVMLFFVASIFVPSLIGFFVGAADWMAFEHPLNPLFVVAYLVDGRPTDIPFGIQFARIGALLVLIANTPRFVRSAREVLAASGSLAPLPPAPAEGEAAV